jgi:hypothetical protein
MPPSYYVVQPRDQTARVYVTVAQAATAIAWLASTPATISGLTGNRIRSLTDTELRELRKRVRVHRLGGSIHHREAFARWLVAQPRGTRDYALRVRRPPLMCVHRR